MILESSLGFCTPVVERLGHSSFASSTKTHSDNINDLHMTRRGCCVYMKGSGVAKGSVETDSIAPRDKRVLLRSGWANTTGQVIRKLEGIDDVWVIERSYLWGPFDVGGKTVVIRLKGGGLFVHAPLALSPTLKERLDEIGNVAVVISPNSEHCDFITQWKFYYPQAKYLAAPELMKKRNDLPFDCELSRSDEADEIYQGEIEQVFINSAPFFNEVVFFHRNSGTLMVTDLFWNYPKGREVPMQTSTWAWAMNHVYRPVYDRFLVKDRDAFALSMRKIMEKPTKQIIPCHGVLVSEDAQETLKRFFHLDLTK